MVAFSSMSESKYLKKEDLNQEQGNIVTIKGFTKVNVNQESDEPEYKFVMHTREFEKPLVLNATNRAVLERAFGPDTDDCIGKQIVMYVEENISYQGKLVGGIRLRQRRVEKPKPSNVDPLDSDIPFN